MIAHEPNITKPTVLFVSLGGLMPVLGGGQSRTWALIDRFRSRGYRVELVTANHGPNNAAVEGRVDRLWVNQPRNAEPPISKVVRIKRLLRRAVERLRAFGKPDTRSILERGRSPGLEVLAGRAACASHPIACIATLACMARALDHMPPGVLRVIDTIDVQHIRAERARSGGGDLSDRQCTREEEIAELTRADALIAIQPEEAEHLAGMCPEQTIVTAGHACTVPAELPPSADSLEVLYVGNLYDPNVRGLRLFFNQVWPRVRAACPGATLKVCGRICAAFRKVPRGVRLAGCVPSLDPHYRRAALVVNPVLYGTGLKIKTIEAIAQCKCVVCTPEGIRGMGSPGELPVTVAGLNADMADRIAELLTHPDLRRAQEEAAWRYASAHLTPEAVYRELDTLIDSHASRFPESGGTPALDLSRGIDHNGAG